MRGFASHLLRKVGPARTAVTKVAGRATVWARPRSCLIVPVLAAEAEIAAWLRQERVDFDGAPLHVTVMYPFLPARSVGAVEEDAVAELARGIQPFDFALARLGRFPGVHYLAPDPAEPFVEITERIQRRWPSCRPYGGAYDAVVPHMTVAFGDQPPSRLADLERVLPVATKANELWLIEQSPDGWRTRRRYPLGAGSPAAADPGAVLKCCNSALFPARLPLTRDDGTVTSEPDTWRSSGSGGEFRRVVPSAPAADLRAASVSDEHPFRAAQG